MRWEFDRTSSSGTRGLEGDSAQSLDRNLTAVLMHYMELAPRTTLSLSISNASARYGPRRRSACDRVEAIFRILGTTPMSRQDNGSKQLELLHQSRFVVAPGESHPFEFQQGSNATETVIFQTIVPRQAQHCLAYSSAAVSNALGDLVSVAPPVSADSFFDIFFDITVTDVEPPACCPCAPICGCGYCP